MDVEKDPKKVAAAEARAMALSDNRKSEIAKQAAVARWGAKATHRGSFKEELGIDVDCYVLDDVEKTAVISQTGMGRALGLAPRGNALPRFLSSQVMIDSVGAELRAKLENPLKFQWGGGGAEMPPGVIHGFDATILIDICKSIIDAESNGKLRERHTNIAKQAHIIVGASAKAGIKGLVYALAGYNPAAEEVIAAFKLYVQEEARKYEPEFPNELYSQWHRLYEIPVPKRGRPWHFKYLTVGHIYHPLAQSSGKILTLLRAEKARGGDRSKKLFQFLNEIGARALRIHLGRVLEMAESSHSQDEYERKITRRFGQQLELDLVPHRPSNASPPASEESRTPTSS